MLLRVIVSEHEIRRLSVEDNPSSVEELYQVLQTNLGLRGGFILQFEDPDFNNELCNLTDIKDLPVDNFESIVHRLMITPQILHSTQAASLPSVVGILSNGLTPSQFHSSHMMWSSI